MPGPLSSHHAQVIARANWSERCATCHPGANRGPTAWLADAWHGGASRADTSALTQSDLCLSCHADLAGEGRAPLLAHGLPAGAFREAIGDDRAITRASLASRPPLSASAHGGDESDPLACAACHQEHHGAGHDLSAITDARCQACHQERYASFASGHPDFGLWPTKRRTRIAFSHASHAGKHFVEAKQRFDCRACHLPDATGDLTARPSYSDACASCHEADLRSSFGDGLAMIALPSLDAEALPGVDESNWPADAIGDFDGEPPLTMRLLLATDRDAAAAMRRLGADFSFFDIDAGDDDQVADAAAIVGALRALLDELQEDGHGAIGYRVRTLVGDANVAPVSEYVGRLPVELVDRLQSTWLAGREGEPGYDAVEDRREGGGWLLDKRSLALRYRPTGHDDPLVRAWIDAALALPDRHAYLREAALAEFSRPGAPGACLSCHTVDRSADGSLAVSWAGRDRLNEPRGFTRFSHRPHLVQPELSDCSHCHSLDGVSTAVVKSSPVGTDPSRFVLEFASLSKSACVQCHQPHAAGDSCTQCHHYHVEPPAGRAIETGHGGIAERLGSTERR
ncbi:MAG: hypothetical protein AAF805_00865 [Planctomycetota bacterium]